MTRILDAVEPEAPVALPTQQESVPAIVSQQGTEAGVALDVDQDTGEVLARDPATGMSVADEEVARALDAGQAEAEPTWKAFADKVEAMIAQASDRESWEKAESEFLKVSGGLPDQEGNRLEDLLDAKKAELVQKMQNLTTAG